MLEKLTAEQEEKMLEVRDYWLDRIFKNSSPIDKKTANEQIEWLYGFSKLKVPIIIYLDSPMGCQIAANLFKLTNVRDNVGANVWDNVGANVRANVRANVWDNVRANVWANVWDNVRANVWDNVRDNVGANVRANVRANVWDNVWANVVDNVWANVRANVELKYESTCSYGSICDYGWVSFYDYFTQIGVINHDGFNQFKKLLQSGIYDMIQLDGLCLVSEMPTVIKRNGKGRLHCEDGPAIKFKDGYSQYYWNGVCVPEFWIMDKSRITKEVVMNEKNAEKRRCLREILGASAYFDVLGGVVEIDRDTDDQGNEMILYRTKKKDDVIDKHIQFLKVICPSTSREYILYPPNQNSKNVWAAKASTFSNEKIEIRHGDVGLLNLEKEYAKPIAES